MELLDYFDRQFIYNAWANREVLDAIKNSSSSASGVRIARPAELLAHIVSAERLWLERLTQQAQSLPVWPALNLDQCQEHIAELSRVTREYIAQLSPAALSTQITYKNTRGEPWSSSVQDVLSHVLLHSAYHRGQIATLMRAGGETPPSTDFIHAVRQGLID